VTGASRPVGVVQIVLRFLGEPIVSQHEEVSLGYTEALLPRQCPQCDSLGPHTIFEGMSADRLAGLECIDCGAFLGWIGYPRKPGQLSVGHVS
jgi:hypothetical protein